MKVSFPFLLHTSLVRVDRVLSPSNSAGWLLLCFQVMPSFLLLLFLLLLLWVFCGGGGGVVLFCFVWVFLLLSLLMLLLLKGMYVECVFHCSAAVQRLLFIRFSSTIFLGTYVVHFFCCPTAVLSGCCFVFRFSFFFFSEECTWSVLSVSQQNCAMPLWLFFHFFISFTG